VPIRAGTDIAFLGGIINYVLTTDSYFRDYVVNYTNGPSIVGDEFADTEDLDGLFSGWDAESRHYDMTTWSYEGVEVAAASGDREIPKSDGDDDGGDDAADSGESSSQDEHAIREAGRAEQHGSGGPTIEETDPERDETMQHPRCVLQILRRHYARYTPQMVHDVCGIPEQTFLAVCRELVENSGPERTSEFVYALGWTQHTTGSQMIRACSVLQLLLGNIGRPGGGIQALRGHASIQGSSDIPTLFNLLPGYLPMPYARQSTELADFIAADSAAKGFWSNMDAYMVSLLKAWWGDAATADNDWCFGYLPRLTGSHAHYDTVFEQLDGNCKGYFLMGENPAVGSANAKLHRLGMANLDWLVVRDFSLIESATWWKNGPEIESGELRTEDVATEVFFFPAAAHTEKSGSFTNTNRMLQWHSEAVAPDGDARSDLWFMYHLGRIIRAELADSDDPVDRPVQHLTWDYPTEGPYDEPSADAILQEVNGWDAEGKPLSAYTELKADGSTRCGCWIYCGVYADGVNQAARRKPHTEQDWVAAEWGWAWPANRRILYNRASARPDGTPWSERKKLVWWDAEAGKWTGYDVPDFVPDRAPDYRPADDATGVDALSGIDPFIMQSDGKGWLFAPAGVVDGPMPTHYEAQDSPYENPLYAQQRNPARLTYQHERNRYRPTPGQPGSGVYPYVVTTYRLTEHFTAGGMTRWVPYLAELQPELFCEVSPELAAERSLVHGEWATIVTPRNAIEARVLVTDRLTPLRTRAGVVQQIGLPYHWGSNGLSTGDTVNDLIAIAADPNANIQEDKVFGADIRPGRRPRGSERAAMVRDYQERAGVTADTGLEV